MWLENSHAAPRATGGRGLGLTIVRQIARQHDGEVTCSEGQVLAGARLTVEYAYATANAYLIWCLLNLPYQLK